MKRLDLYLFEAGLLSSREKAKRAVLKGSVKVNGNIVTKPSLSVGEDDKIELLEEDRYVGRGAYKLLGAFDAFGLDVSGKVCADIGASTGGFTQVLLEKGAARVYAVDVGHGQLAQILADDGRVTNCEGVNVRDLKDGFFDEEVSFVCADLSFISLRQVLGAVLDSVSENVELVLLIKPQFEAGKDSVGKNGIVRDRKKHREVLGGLFAFFVGEGLSFKGLTHSPISGGDGNIEYLAYLTREGDSITPDITGIVDGAFEKVKR